VSATLRLVREAALAIELRRGPFEVLLDGNPIGTIEWHGTFEQPIAPGHHTIRMRHGRYSSRDHSFDAADGQTVVYQVHGAMVWPQWLVSYIKTDFAINMKREELA
jgi:hypothetical protein